jgi:16S rRNA processing protein RimM
MTGNDEMIILGCVGRAKGLDGSFRLVLYNPDSTQLDHTEELLVQGPAGQQETLHLIGQQRIGEKGVRIVQVREITSRTEAEQRKGWSLVVAKSALPPVSEGEFYYHEMPGFLVETEAGDLIGTIKQVIGTNIEIFVIDRSGGGELLIPVIEDMVCVIDRAQRRVVVVNDIEERFEDVL